MNGQDKPVRGSVSDGLVRAALAQGAAMLHARQVEVLRDIASHEMELGRLACERDRLLAALPTGEPEQ